MEIKVRINGKHISAPLDTLQKVIDATSEVKNNHPNAHICIEMVIEPKGDYDDF